MLVSTISMPSEVAENSCLITQRLETVDLSVSYVTNSPVLLEADCWVQL